MASKNPKYLNCLFVLDDNFQPITQKMDDMSPAGVSAIVDCTITGRALRMGGICLTNSLTATSQIARQNCSAFFVCSVTGENPWILRNTIGLTDEQIEDFRKKSAKRGYVICYNPEIIDAPVLAQSQLIVIPGKCDELMRQVNLNTFKKQVHWLPAAPTSAFRAPVPLSVHAPAAKTQLPKLSNLPARAMEFLICTVTGVPKPTSKIKDLMNISFTELRRTTKKLENTGIIICHWFSTGRTGGKYCFYELTASAWSLLRIVGKNPPKPLTNGGFEHELAAQLISAKGIAAGFAVRCEVDVDGIRGDVVFTDKQTGARILHNVGISHPEHEVESLLKFLKLTSAGHTKYILVARDSNYRKNVVALLKKKDPSGEIQRRIEIKLMADFIN
jgi:hypothetical protein